MSGYASHVYVICSEAVTALVNVLGIEINIISLGIA